MKKRITFLFFLLGCTAALLSNPNMIVKEYTFEHGLPHNSVYAAMKDHQGMMWFASWYGLSSFDGVKFKAYNRRDDITADIPPHKLQSIVEAHPDFIWVKTIDHNLFLFNKKSERFFDVFNVIKQKYNVSPKIIKIQKQVDGTLLLLTKNRDLLRASVSDSGRIDVHLLYDSALKLDRSTSGSNVFFESSDQVSWVGTDYRIINCRKGDSLKKKPVDYISRKLGLNNQNAELSSAHQAGNVLWLGDIHGAVAQVDCESGEIRKQLLFQGKAIRNINVTADRQLFVSLDDGVYQVDYQTGRIQKRISLSGSDRITESFVDSYDKLWLIINQDAVVFYDPVNLSSRRYSIPEGKVLPELRISDGMELGLFLLSTSGELLWFDRSTGVKTILNDLKDLQQDGEKRYFFNFLLDKDNILWLSSTSQGVSRVSFPKPQFKLLQIPGTMKNEGDHSVKTLFQSRNGDIWMATRKPEVYQLDRQGQVKQFFSESHNFDFGSVYNIMEDREGNLWFSTKGRGLVKAIPDQSQSTGYRFLRFLHDERNPSSISGNDVYYTYQDSRGNIWVALFGGGLNLVSEEKGQHIFYHKGNSFHHYPKFGLYMEVRSMVEDQNGRIWVGTSDGLMSFDGSFAHPNQIEFEIYRNVEVRSHVSDNDIYVLFRDSEAQLWVSVFGGGLNKLESYDADLKKPTFSTYSMNEGLNSDVVLSVVEDDEGYLWLATENGITRFDKEHETFRNFDRYDGFINVKMEEESALKCMSGDLWFGSRMGILAFNPREIETFKVDYQTLIVDFLISNRDLKSFNGPSLLQESIRYAKSIELKHNQNNFVIEFAALNYYNLNRVSYKYMLEGYEDEWHYNGRNRIASYPNVPPGKYEFVVQTMDEANADLHSERRLVIRVLPPWWRSWWAYMIYSIIGLAIAFAIQKLILFTIRMRNDVYIEQKVSEMKLRFFTNISHELRTPLTLIMGPIHELKEKQHLTEKGGKYIALIEKSANQMLQLVNQILDFRKLEHGKMVLHVAHLDMNRLIDSFRNEFEILSEEKRIRYSFQLSEDEILLWGDKERLEIVFRNIISNAFKFTEAGGSIFVSTSLSANQQSCIVKIEDTGIGIPQNKIAEIFERFTQGEHAKQPYYQGTGIGLHLSREIVSMHHGNIFVEGRPEKGSVFTIELPLGKDHFIPSEVNFYLGDEVDSGGTTTELPAYDPELVPTDHPANEQLPLLVVVEDNRDLCDLLKLQLEEKFRIILAYNGEEGLKKISHHHPDLVITDLMMPVMNGMEMLKQIRKDIEISHIPVVILTAKHNEDAKIQSISMGANAYITKPFNREYLIARVEQLLNDRRMFRERIWNRETEAVLTPEETYENYLVKKDLQLLEKIHQVIGENIQNPDYSIDAIAESLGFSRSAFFKKLKSLTGLAPVDLIKEIRLSKSIELLKNTDMTISEIAFEVGFKEAGYYGKCFRKKYNQTPSEYMNIHRKAKVPKELSDENETTT